MNSSSTSHSLLYLFLSLYQSSVFFFNFFWLKCLHISHYLFLFHFISTEIFRVSDLCEIFVIDFSSIHSDFDGTGNNQTIFVALSTVTKTMRATSADSFVRALFTTYQNKGQNIHFVCVYSNARNNFKGISNDFTHVTLSSVFLVFSTTFFLLHVSLDNSHRCRRRHRHRHHHHTLVH